MIQHHISKVEQDARREAVRKYLLDHPGATATSIAAHLGIPRSSVRRSMVAVGGEQPKALATRSQSMGGGFTLDGRRVLATRPTDVWRARFYGLRRGTGYHVDYLAERWGNSPDTVRAQARRHGALRYVEDVDRPGEYMACAVHPDTPKGL